jgi:hypothetical protein
VGFEADNKRVWHAKLLRFNPSKQNVLLKYMDVKEMMLLFVGDSPVVGSLHQNPRANGRCICLMVPANITSHGP